MEGSGRRDRTDQVGLERRASMSSGSLGVELYARVKGIG